MQEYARKTSAPVDTTVDHGTRSRRTPRHGEQRLIGIRGVKGVAHASVVAVHVERRHRNECGLRREHWRRNPQRRLGERHLAGRVHLELVFRRLVKAS